MNTTICINELKDQYYKINEERVRVLEKICDQLTDLLDDLPIVDDANDIVKVQFHAIDDGNIEIDVTCRY